MNNDILPSSQNDILPPQIKSPTFAFVLFKRNTNFNLINGEEILFFIYYAEIWCINALKRNEALNLRRPEKESASLNLCFLSRTLLTRFCTLTVVTLLFSRCRN